MALFVLRAQFPGESFKRVWTGDYWSHERPAAAKKYRSERTAKRVLENQRKLLCDDFGEPVCGMRVEPWMPG